jgi:hypothetical protein
LRARGHIRIKRPIRLSPCLRRNAPFISFATALSTHGKIEAFFSDAKAFFSDAFGVIVAGLRQFKA